MKIYLLSIMLAFGFLFTNSAQAQMEHCCKNNKKVKIKKQKKRTRGALVGVKGFDDKKALKAKAKQMKADAKARKLEKKAAVKDEKELKSLEQSDDKLKESDPFDNLGLEKPDDLKEEPAENSGGSSDGGSN